MSAMCEVPVDVVDEMNRMESRIAFLGAAICAISELEEIDMHAQLGPEVWRGLFYWTQDLEDMLRRLNEMANPE